MKLRKLINHCIILIQSIIIFSAGIGCSKESVPPILILARQNNFGTYTGEILKAEGFNEFVIDSLKGKNISRSFLDRFELVLLADSDINSDGWRMLSEYVMKGGNLIVVQPVHAPADIFGFVEMPGKLSGGSIVIDTLSQEGKSLSGRKLQLHGNACRSYLKGGKAVVWLTERSVNKNCFPGVVIHSFGKGRTAAFLFNLAENIVFTRQGNPSLAGIEKDGIPGLRAMDMFTDGWVETSNNVINQADEQMILLSHIIEDMTRNRKPLPRLWYFPDTLKCLVTLTNDGEFKSDYDFETQFRDIDSMGAKMSLYVLETGKVKKQWTDRWAARGFEISGHPDDTKEALRPNWNNMDSVTGAKIKNISDLYGIQMTTVVNHWFLWCGNNAEGQPEFAAQAEIEANHGLLLDINYAHYDNNSGQGHFLGPPGMNQGNFTGSGLPMRFTESTGKILNIYQHLNNVYDQQYNENHDPEGFFNCFKGIMDRSLYDEVYSYISIKSHNDEYYFSRSPLLRILEYSKSKNIPVWTAARLIDFIEMKDGAEFSGVKWSGNELAFDLVTSTKNKNGLTYMVPGRIKDLEIKKITINGKVVPFIIRLVRGSEYALNTVEPGSNYSILVSYGK